MMMIIITEQLQLTPSALIAETYMKRERQWNTELLQKKKNQEFAYVLVLRCNINIISIVISL